MFRTCLPRRALLAAASAITVSSIPHEKLSIYPRPDPEILLQDTASELERQIGKVRVSLVRSYGEGYERVQGVVDKWIGIEKAVEHRIKSIIAPNEPLTPGLLYVGVSTLTGSILTRNRSLFYRYILPPTLFFISLNHFLPRTSQNLSSYLGSLEDHYLPFISEKHEVAKAHTKMSWERVKEGSKDGRERFGEGVGSVVGKVQELTGLKLKETLGVVEVKSKELIHKAEVMKKEVVDKQVEEVKEVVEKKVEEVKRLV